MISKYSSHQSSLSIIENNKIISNSYKHIHLPLPAIAHDTRICFYKIVVPILNNCFHSSPMRTQKWLDIDIDTVAAPCRQRVCRRIVSSSDQGDIGNPSRPTIVFTDINAVCHHLSVPEKLRCASYVSRPQLRLLWRSSFSNCN